MKNGGRDDAPNKGRRCANERDSYSQRVDDTFDCEIASLDAEIDAEMESLRRLPKPKFSTMTIEEIEKLVRSGDPMMGAAIVELVDRAGGDGAAASLAGEMARLQIVRNFKFNLYSLSDFVIVSLIVMRSLDAQQAALSAYNSLDLEERRNILRWLQVSELSEARGRDAGKL